MADLQLNNQLDVFIDRSGDLAYATGRDAFEQEILLSLVDYYYENAIGEVDPATALETVRIGARRAVDNVDLLDRVETVNARFSDDVPNTIIVDIVFDTGEQLVFESDSDGEVQTVSTTIYDDGVFESTSSMDVYEDGTLQ